MARHALPARTSTFRGALCLTALFLLTGLLSPLFAKAKNPPPLAALEAVTARARLLCSQLLETPVVLSSPRVVSQKSGQIYPTGLPPVWHLTLLSPEKKAIGHLMLETDAALTLHEFAFDLPTPPSPKNGVLIPSVPNLQQFPTPEKADATGPQVASGCVPTAGGSLIGFWALQGFSKWLPTSDTPSTSAALQSATLRLRHRMHMGTFPDISGYTDNGMPLSGALPDDLAESLRKDASEHGIDAKIYCIPFKAPLFETQIQQRRPALLSCVVRLPHKPELSWGHEVLGVGFDRIEGARFVGIVDNFFPTAHPHTIRWIRESVFDSMITVHCH